MGSPPAYHEDRIPIPYREVHLSRKLCFGYYLTGQVCRLLLVLVSDMRLSVCQ